MEHHTQGEITNEESNFGLDGRKKVLHLIYRLEMNTCLKRTEGGAMRRATIQTLARAQPDIARKTYPVPKPMMKAITLSVVGRSMYGKVGTNSRERDLAMISQFARYRYVS
jgi:hypothetical protein